MSGLMLHIHGTVASPGLAEGPLYFLEDESVATPTKAHEHPGRALEAALARAIGEIAALIELTADEDAKDLLEFQIAMLEDETLLAPARAALLAGADAKHAWMAAIEQQLAQFIDADDPYFRARSADLEDMRERVLRCIDGAAQRQIPPGAIVVARDLVPSRFLETDWQGGGIALTGGSAKSHLAMLARSRGVPMLIGTPAWDFAGHSEALLDTETATLIVSPDAEVRLAFAARMNRARLDRASLTELGLGPAKTRSQVPIKVQINIADARELEGLDPGCCDGIGLVRTELLLRTRAALLDEEGQFAAYGAILRWAGGKPVTIRTLDAGSDKPIPGYTLEEGNPFLGTRGVRLSLANPEIFSIQLRALARAAALGPLRVMVPMVTLPEELEAVRALFEDVLGGLASRGVAHRRFELGMMVEVPAAALTIETFQAAFLSIGSNDLIQYLCAASRDLAGLATLQEPLQPAVLGVIGALVEYADRAGLDVSLCGDMAAEPRCVPALIALGLRSLSVAPLAIERVKAAIAQVP
jgi:phosphotransferase system enzyme I (PtsI)